jgi:hypothetical protein
MSGIAAPTVLFALGRPGCGKSTAAKYIQQQWRYAQNGQPYEAKEEEVEKDAYRIKDYTILYEMFQQDRAGEDKTRRRFRDAIVHGEVRGFDVVDFTVLDEALEKTVQAVVSCMKDALLSSRKKIIIVEFARNDYKDVFEKLSAYLDAYLDGLFEPCSGQDLLSRSFFLFVEAPLHVCSQRIHERVKSPVREDNHFVSDDILRSYYEVDDGEYIQNGLERDYKVDPTHIRVIHNNASQEVFLKQVEAFLQETLLNKVPAF